MSVKFYCLLCKHKPSFANCACKAWFTQFCNCFPMNAILPHLFIRLIVPAILVFFVSCGSSTDQDSKEIEMEPTVPINPQENPAELLLGPSPLPDGDLEELINQGNLADISDVNTSFQNDASTNDQSFVPPSTLTKNSPPKSLPPSPASRSKYEAELALKRLEENSINHQKITKDLQEINSFKDRTIASLSTLNDELLIEIKKLKTKNSKTSNSPRTDGISSEADGGIMISELQNLKNSLLLKSTEIKDLRMRNDSLEKRISSLETSPMPSISLRPPRLALNPENLNDSSPSVLQNSSSQASGCILKFDAVVTSLNGKSKEAFYTEFFVVKEDLESVMFKGGLDLSAYPTIATYSELWARSRKNSFLFPGMQKKFRALLLDLVEGGKGMRVRTNIDGFATVDNLNSGKYFVIGTASLGRVGVTWSVPVILSPGTNKLSLTLENAAWSL